MLATEPRPDVAPCHGRQVALLGPDAWAVWLDRAAAAGDLLGPALAVRLMMAVVSAHPFEQGNKRTGLAAAAVFLEANGWLLDISDFEDIADEIIDAAEDDSLEADLLELFGRNLIEMA